MSNIARNQGTIEALTAIMATRLTSLSNHRFKADKVINNPFSWESIAVNMDEIIEKATEAKKLALENAAMCGEEMAA